MARRRFARFVLIFGLTFLNIWLAKYIIRPTRRIHSLETTARPRQWKMSDVLVISIEDVHPLQHLEESSSIDKTTDTVDLNSSQHKDTYWSVLSASNNLTTNPELHFIPDMTRDNSYNIPNLNNYRSSSGNRMNDDDGAAVNDIYFSHSQKTSNFSYYQSVPKPKLDNSPFVEIQQQFANTQGNNMGSNKLVSNTQENNSLNMGNSQLGYLATEELVSIKESLEALKAQLMKLKLSQENSPALPSNPEPGVPQKDAQGKRTMFGDKVDPNLLSYGSDRDTGGPILDNLKDNLTPPPNAAAKAIPDPKEDLLKKLLTTNDKDTLSAIVNKNPAAVYELLNTILRHQEMKNHQHQQNHQQLHQERLQNADQQIQTNHRLQNHQRQSSPNLQKHQQLLQKRLKQGDHQIQNSQLQIHQENLRFLPKQQQLLLNRLQQDNQQLQQLQNHQQQQNHVHPQDRQHLLQNIVHQEDVNQPQQDTQRQLSDHYLHKNQFSNFNVPAKQDNKLLQEMLTNIIGDNYVNDKSEDIQFLNGLVRDIKSRGVLRTPALGVARLRPDGVDGGGNTGGDLSKQNFDL